MIRLIERVRTDATPLVHLMIEFKAGLLVRNALLSSADPCFGLENSRRSTEIRINQALLEPTDPPPMIPLLSLYPKYAAAPRKTIPTTARPITTQSMTLDFLETVSLVAVVAGGPAGAPTGGAAGGPAGGATGGAPGTGTGTGATGGAPGGAPGTVVTEEVSSVVPVA